MLSVCITPGTVAARSGCATPRVPRLFEPYPAEVMEQDVLACLIDAEIVRDAARHAPNDLARGRAIQARDTS